MFHDNIVIENKQSDTNISDVSPVENIAIEPKESIQDNKEDLKNLEDDNNFNNDSHLSFSYSSSKSQNSIDFSILFNLAM